MLTDTNTLQKRLLRAVDEFRENSHDSDALAPDTRRAYKDAADQLQQILEIHIDHPAPETVLEQADEIIHGERLKHYGHPKLNFDRIAKGWEQYFGHEVSMMDVASCMIILKVMRMTEGYHRDSVVDIGGYAALMAVVEDDDEL